MTIASPEKYQPQKRYLKSKKQLRVWVDPDMFDKFKSDAENKGTSVYALINSFINEYCKEEAEN